VLKYGLIRHVSGTSVLTVIVNGASHIVRRSDATVADLLRDLALEGKRVAVEKNGSIVPRSQHAATCVGAGDKIEIVAAVGGG
jgi:sulfur carrier protein